MKSFLIHLAIMFAVMMTASGIAHLAYKLKYRRRAK